MIYSENVQAAAIDFSCISTDVKFNFPDWTWDRRKDENVENDENIENEKR